MYLFTNTKEERALNSLSAIQAFTHTHNHIYLYIHAHHTARSHVPLFFFFFLLLQVARQELRPAEGLAKLDKRNQCSPAIPGLETTRLGFLLHWRWEGPCGPEPCKQMSAAAHLEDHHVKYLQQQTHTHTHIRRSKQVCTFKTVNLIWSHVYFK